MQLCFSSIFMPEGVLGLASTGLALQMKALHCPVGLSGAADLAWLSWDSWRAARHEYMLDLASAGGTAAPCAPIGNY